MSALDLEAVAGRVDAARASGETVAFTNGCFDLLHGGHLALLEAAAAAADRLVVALNDDASVRALKGEGRPHTPFAERAELLAGLAVVDWVVGFGDPTPLSLIERLRPDVLAKGADWEPDAIVGADLVRRAGGRVLRVPLREGRSTSALLERMRRASTR